MNYRYVPDADGVLKAIVERQPSTTLHELRQGHPMLQSMSMDRLSLLLERTARRRDRSWGR